MRGVTIELEAAGDAVEPTVVHDGFEEGSTTFGMTSQGRRHTA